MIGLLSDDSGAELPKISPLEQSFEGLFRVKKNVTMILGGQRRKIKKGDLITIQSLQSSLDKIGDLIEPGTLEVIRDTIKNTTDKFLQLIPMDSYVIPMDITRVTAEEVKRVMRSTEKIPFPPEATTMFDVIDILKAEKSGE